MAAAAITVQGTLDADGTLHLDQAPGLPPGWVEVTVKAVAEDVENQTGWWEVLQRIRAE